MEDELQAFDPFSPSKSSGGQSDILTSPISGDGDTGRQAILREKDGQYFLENFDPGQPASVNGKLVRPGSCIALKDGDSVQLGAATPLKFTYAMGDSAKSNPRIASVQKSVHFNERSPKVFEVTPDQRNSEHKSLKGRKQTPLSGFLPHDSPGKLSSRLHERPMTSSVERPQPAARPNIAKVVTPLKGAARKKQPASAVVKRANTLEDLTKVLASEPRGGALKKCSSSASLISRSRPLQRNLQPAAKKFETPKISSSNSRLLGVTPVADSHKKSAFPRFAANTVTSASKSESRVQFTLNNRRQFAAGHYSAQPNRNVRPSHSITNFCPCSPEDLSLANVSEWVDQSAASPDELLALENSQTEMNRRLSVQEEEVLTDEDDQPVVTRTSLEGQEQFVDPAEQPVSSRKARRSSSAPEIGSARRKSVPRRSAAPVEQEPEPCDTANPSEERVVEPMEQTEPPRSANRRKSRPSKIVVPQEEPQVEVEEPVVIVVESSPPKSANRRRKSRPSKVPKTPVEAEVEIVNEEPAPPKSANRRKSKRSLAPVPDPVEFVESVEPVVAEPFPEPPVTEMVEETVPVQSNRRKSRRSSVVVVDQEPVPALDETYELVDEIVEPEMAPSSNAMTSPMPMPFSECPLPSPAVPVQNKRKSPSKKATATPIASLPEPTMVKTSAKKTPAKARPQETLATPMPFAEHPLISPTFPTKKSAKKTQPKEVMNSPMPFAEHPLISPTVRVARKTKVDSPMPFAEHPMISPTLPTKKKTALAKKSQPAEVMNSPMPFTEYPMLSPVVQGRKKPASAKKAGKTESPFPFVEHPIVSPTKVEEASTSQNVPIAVETTPVLAVEETATVASAMRKTQKSAKKSIGVTFAEQQLLTSPPQGTKKSVLPTRMQVTPANLGHKFRPSIGTSPGHRGSLRKVMMKRLVELKKTEQGTTLPPTSPGVVTDNQPSTSKTPPKKPAKRQVEIQTMSPDPVAMKKMFNSKKKCAQESPNLTSGEIKRLFEPKKTTKNRQSAILSPIAMKRMFKQKRKSNESIDPDRGAMKNLFRDTTSTAKKAKTTEEPILSPGPMQRLFSGKDRQQKAPAVDILSPNALKRMFPEKKRKHKLDLNEELPLPELFVEPQPAVVERQVSQESESGTSKPKKTAHFADPVVQPSEHVTEEVTVEEPEPTKTTGRRRGKKAKEEPDQVVEETQPRKTRRGRKQPEEETTTEDPATEETVPAPAPRRSRKVAAPVPVEEPAVEEPAVVEPPKRGGRKKKVEPQPEVEEAPTSPAAPSRTGRQRGRTPKTVVPEPEVQTIEEEPVQVKPKRGKAVATVEEDQAPVETEPTKKGRRGRAAAETEKPPVEPETKPTRGRGKKEVIPEPAETSEAEQLAIPKLARKSTIRVTRAMAKSEESIAAASEPQSLEKKRSRSTRK